MSEQSGKIFVSACMMVKNEQANIARCLKSIKDVVDEIVIVDTGSEDRTVEIAESFGARIFHHPWENDFSKHRNQSISYAQGDWVFIIDADEELVITRQIEGSKKENALRDFLKLIDQKDHNVSGLLVKDIQRGNIVMQFNSSRLFKNGTVHYEGIVHNAAITDNQTSVLCEWMHIRHYGYDLSPEQKEAKFQRTSKLLQKRIEEDPKDYQAMFYLCQLNADSGRDTKASIAWGEKYVRAKDEIKKTGRNFNESIYFTLFRTTMADGNLNRAKDLIQEAIAEFGGDIDIALAIVEYGVATNDNMVILEGCQGFLDHWNRNGKDATAKGNKFTYAYRPEGLAYILFHQSLVHLIQGAQGTNQMVEVLSKLPAPMRDGYMIDFQRRLDEAGVPLQISFAPDKESIKNNIVSAELPQEAFQ